MAKNKKTWKMEKGKWVQYQNGVKTGKTRRTPLPAIKGGAKAVTGLATRPFNQLRKGASFAKKVGGNVLREALHIPSKEQQAYINEARKQREAKTTKTTTTTKSKGSSKDQDDARKEAELSTYLKNKPKGGYTAKNAGPDKGVTGKKFVPSKKGESKSTTSSGSTVHTRHYKTGERLGVMTRSQRRAYDKAAAGRTFESEVAKHEKSSGHGKSHKRETLYKASLRKGGTKSSTSTKEKNNRAALKAGAEERGNPGVRGGDADYGTNKDGSVRRQPKASEQIKKYKPKKKKKNLTKNEIKYPTRGTFRGI